MQFLLRCSRRLNWGSCWHCRDQWRRCWGCDRSESRSFELTVHCRCFTVSCVFFTHSSRRPTSFSANRSKFRPWHDFSCLKEAEERSNIENDSSDTSKSILVTSRITTVTVQDLAPDWSKVGNIKGGPRSKQPELYSTTLLTLHYALETIKTAGHDSTMDYRHLYLSSHTKFQKR